MINIEYTNLVYYIEKGKVVDCYIANHISYSALLTYANQYNHKNVGTSRKMSIKLIPEDSLEGYLIDQLNKVDSGKIKQFDLTKHICDVHKGRNISDEY